MKKTLLLLVTAGLLVGCTGSSLDMSKGQKFTFDDKEMESKLTYYCVQDTKLGDPAKRAKATHTYFTKQNTANAEKLVQSAMEGKSSEDATKEFMLNTEKLGKSLNEKFGCMLVDTVDY